jgi:hypothetical protein
LSEDPSPESGVCGGVPRFLEALKDAAGLVRDLLHRAREVGGMKIAKETVKQTQISVPEKIIKMVTQLKAREQ